MTLEVCICGIEIEKGGGLRLTFPRPACGDAVPGCASAVPARLHSRQKSRHTGLRMHNEYVSEESAAVCGLFDLFLFCLEYVI